VDYIRTVHYVAGVEYLPISSLNLRLEGFYKDYSNYPVSARDSLSLANLGGGFGVFGNEAVRSVGLGRTYGLEFSSQKQFNKRFYGLLAYTLYWSEFTGFDTEDYARSAWDNRHLISMTGGYRFGKNQTWEFAAKWRFLGPTPYTPFDVDASVQLYLQRGEALPDYDLLNTKETGVFSQLDVRLDKRWFFEKWTLNLFLDIQNVLNTENSAPPNFTLERTEDGSAFRLDDDGNYIPTLIAQQQTALIPSIGIRIKF
jgi:hypothetical protein